MKEELISFETAKLAKEKGFDRYIKFKNIFYQDSDKIFELEWDLLSQFYCVKTNVHILIQNEKNTFARPTQSLLQKWLREKHSLFAQPEIEMIVNNTPLFIVTVISNDVRKNSKFGICKMLTITGFKSYEKALETGLQEALNLIKT